MKPVEVLIEKQQAKNERLLTLEYLILNKAAGEDGAYKTNDNTPSNVAAAELAALTARLAQAERELAFFRNQFPTAAKRWQEAVEKEQQP